LVYSSIRHLKSPPLLALTCLLNPVSNAVVERVFSLVSSVKTKARHRMQLNLLDAIVSVRAEQLFSIKGCKNLTASLEMLKTSHWTRFIPYVPLTPMGRVVMTSFRSFACDGSMKNILKFVWLFWGGEGAFFQYCLALH